MLASVRFIDRIARCRHRRSRDYRRPGGDPREPELITFRAARNRARGTKIAKHKQSDPSARGSADEGRALTGQVALVTAAGAGIGRASAIGLARAGARVVVSDIAVRDGQETVRLIADTGGEATFVKADVTRASEVEALVDHVLRTYGRLDCAHNNAGGATKPDRILTHEYDEAIWRRDFDLNLHSAWLCMKFELPLMLEQGSGCIVNTASIMGLVATRGATAYAAAKHAVVGLTRAAALEYAQAGIRINAICPGYIPTRTVREIMDTDPSLEAQFTSKHPIGRMGTPEEIAAAVVWLCTDAASFVTGHALPVDGGYTAQ